MFEYTGFFKVSWAMRAAYFFIFKFRPSLNPVWIRLWYFFRMNWEEVIIQVIFEIFGEKRAKVTLIVIRLIVFTIVVGWYQLWTDSTNFGWIIGNRIIIRFYRIQIWMVFFDMNIQFNRSIFCFIQAIWACFVMSFHMSFHININAFIWAFTTCFHFLFSLELFHLLFKIWFNTDWTCN